MTNDQKALIRATVPVLREHGVALTTYFYNRLLTHNPELKNVFNSANQRTGAQPTALAMSVLAYAEHIDNPEVLSQAINRIAHKHVSLDIRPEQYAVVGKHLLASISEVLGEAATSELLEAWGLAYQQLAQVMSNVEANLYSNTVAKAGGWSSWRPFVVQKKIRESEEITSFYLYPSDGGKVADFLPGQFITVRLFVPELQVLQPRQYSISCAPNGNYYRISVKKERGSAERPAGFVSNLLHDKIQEGDILEVAPPAGDFILDVTTNNPIVFISGGVGLTPFMSMLEYLIQTGKDRAITWIHGCRGYEVHAFKESVSELGGRHQQMAIHTFYNKLDDHTQEFYYEGFVDLTKVKEAIVPQADYYICGPAVFIKKHVEYLRSQGVNAQFIHFEEFGPAILVV
ncbi:NO-inducible flavohemoprotein [Siphonobacter sp. SORGH_AS_0500]|uniref:NO-inducible flavohemoprotein n=1 Tax=Siphonobacter sp. SORGH_AS_0500 TaxID=1864824 RepID=UPI002861059B|nr:NO-inducible flavohemoprotein [Siphonobacter sp. SORGH_AS_0500]MDR6197555.1 nitric oxide dioxygenase [Siphonobacter sp. SORGH_AS_0500]